MPCVPSEIWRDIFAYACTDGGYTGNSIALVCKFFHNVSLPVRFHSLSFSSLRQVELFLAYATCHRMRYPGRAPKIHHLLLSFPCPPSFDIHREVGSDGSSSESSNSIDQWVIARRLREQDKAAWDQRFCNLVSGLLQLAASHLQTLALLQSDGFTVPPIKHPLPQLRELTLLVGISVMLNEDDTPALGGSSDTTQPLSPQPPRPSAAASGSPSELRAAPASNSRPRFPALERLHIVCGRHRDFSLSDTLAHLPRLAPALTHLRISNATYTHESCIPPFLRAALGLACPDRHGAQGPPEFQPASGDDGDSCGWGSPRAALPDLRHVVVHSVPPPAGGAEKEYATLVRAVHAIGASASGARVLSVQGQRAKQQCWEQRVEREWVERIEGRLGCWSGCDCWECAGRVW